MKTITKQLAGSILAAAVSLMLAACRLDNLIDVNTGSGRMTSGSGEIYPCEVTAGTGANSVLQCQFIDGESTITLPTQLLAAQAILWIFDPLIVEIPASATGPSGFLTGGPLGLGAPLQITSGLTSIPIDTNTTLVAEPGKQLVIVDVPSGFTPTPGMKSSFSFHYVDLTHAPVKVIFAAKIQAGGTTYYPPLAPCVTDFGGVPEVSAGLTLAQLAALLAGMTPCDHKAYDFGVAGPPPAAANYQGLWWSAPANSESGWGINLAHQGDTIFASWFTYDMSGRDWWLVMTAQKSGANTYSGTLYQTRGPTFDAASFDPETVVATEAGSGTLTFTDASNGTFSYTIGAVTQAKAITRELFGPLPVCTYGGGSLAAATNYQDLWWAKPAASESGWGINLNHQGDRIFATWFTYDLDHAPLWLVVTALRKGANVFEGDLYQTSGARFDAFDPHKVAATKVGTATFTFGDGNNATFQYTVQLPGMGAPVAQAKAITRELFSPSGTTCL